MRLSDFDYPLPAELVAQTPAARRDDSRLLVVPAGRPLAHRAFAELPDLLPRDALLVVNDARVVPARLRARKPTGGLVEIFLVERREVIGDREVWGCLVRGGKALAGGLKLTLQAPEGRSPAGPPPVVTFLGRRPEDEEARVAFELPGGILAALDDWGEVPLPPYIERPAGPTADDRERYQTVFAQVPGAVAAPTAGLHFTPQVLARLADRGVERAAITLHVGPGTFAPVRHDAIEDHVMHVERFHVPEETARAHAAARAAGRPIVAVGTTVLRALESALDGDGRVTAGAGETRLFIYPGWPGGRVRSADLLLTNFHMPRSTLLMLVCAFAGRERILHAYADAVARRYRFFSYGDAMLLAREDA
jgi:S-adenosylmethionine:tRNA ribosyltransferase-isomerase